MEFLFFVHELGHFLVAKWCGVGVLEFAIGFGPKLYGFKWGETTYTIRVIPLGGFVRMIGEDSETIEKMHEAEEKILSKEEKALLNQPEKWFVNKNLLQKSSIVFAGPLFNLIFAFIAGVAGGIVYGAPVSVNLPILGEIVPKYPAQKAGLQIGDKVLSISGKKITTWEEITKTVRGSEGKPLTFLVEREEAETPLSFTVEPSTNNKELMLLEGTPDKKVFMIGASPSSELQSLGVLDAVHFGLFKTYQVSKLTLVGLWGMVTGRISTDHIGGPITIFKEAAKSAKRGLSKTIDFLIFLSVSLAILNLLPIPVLDGGHLLLFFIEGVIVRKKLSPRFTNIVNQVGLTLLLLLMTFALTNDIRHQL